MGVLLIVKVVGNADSKRGVLVNKRNSEIDSCELLNVDSISKVPDNFELSFFQQSRVTVEDAINLCRNLLNVFLVVENPDFISSSSEQII